MSLSKTLLLMLMLAAPAALANDFKLKDLVIEHPYARATPPGAKTSGAFLTIRNNGKTLDKLINASTSAAKFVEIHEMSMDGGMMTMRAIPGVEIKAGAKVELGPGGYHIMLFDLKASLKAGDKVPLTLVFENAGKLDVVVDVEGMTGGAAHPMH